MNNYTYRAKKGPEEIVEGAIDARTEKEAIEKLVQQGYVPIRVVEANIRPQAKPRAPEKRGGRVSSREVTVFSRQLAGLLKSGVPILNAINIISEQAERPGLKAVLSDCHNAIREGATFSSTLEAYPKVFSPLYIALIRAGENSGTLPEALFRVAEYRIKQEEMFSRFMMAMAYPALMALVGLGTVIFMLVFVIPRLVGIFVNMGQVLPLPTRILIFISSGLRQWWLWIVIAAVAITLLGKRQAATKAGRLFFSKLKLKLPVFGKFVLKAELARFSRTLELLIRSGISILKAIDVAIPVLDNEVIRGQLRKSYKDLEQGGSLGKSLKDSKLFPLFMSNLIIVGEASGALDEALSEVANAYERDTDEMMKMMSSLLEPIMILVMGLVVGFIVIAMLLPVFEINVMVR
ncbi:MAG: type II secretion system F family protein [Candidatus Omnitrophota bacterium]